MEEAHRRDARATQGWEPRGPGVTDVGRIEAHNGISPDVLKAGRKANHISTAVQRWKEKHILSLSLTMCSLH